jgi:hypothetical protein
MTGTVHKGEGSEERRGILLPQFEIMTEPEEELLDDLRTEDERVQEFERMVQEGKAGTLQGLLQVCYCNLYKIMYCLPLIWLLVEVRVVYLFSCSVMI